MWFLHQKESATLVSASKRLECLQAVMSALACVHILLYCAPTIRKEMQRLRKASATKKAKASGELLTLVLVSTPSGIVCHAVCQYALYLVCTVGGKEKGKAKASANPKTKASGEVLILILANAPSEMVCHVVCSWS